MTANACERCGEPVGLRRFVGHRICGQCAAQERAARARALDEYRSLAAAVADPRTNPSLIGDNLPAIAQRAGLTDRKVRDLNLKALHTAFDQALADEILTVAEEQRLERAAQALGFGTADLERVIAHYQEPLFIARVNDGRLPELVDVPIILKREEVGHLQLNAVMLKEAVVRQYQGGSRGMSFRIARGVSYRVGSHRGEIRDVGTEIKEVDSGQLVITSRRAVFTGARKTQEVRYDKLLSVNVFANAIQFHVSNRQTPSLFRVPSGPMAAAAVNAAAQRLQ